MTLRIRDARPDELDLVRTLFVEYKDAAKADECFEGFQAELRALPGEYVPPDGALLLAESDGHVVGCVALRRLDVGLCEMRRLYVRPGQQGQGLGRMLVEALLRRGRELGFRRVRLDTIPSMAVAVAMYRNMGFQEIERYNDCPAADTLFFERAL